MRFVAPSFEGKSFIQVIMPSMRELVMILVYCLYGTVWHVCQALYFIVFSDLSMFGFFNYLVYMCRVDRRRVYCRSSVLNALSPWQSLMLKPLGFYMFGIVYMPLMIFCFSCFVVICTDKKFNLLELVYRKGMRSTLEKYMYSCISLFF